MARISIVAACAVAALLAITAAAWTANAHGDLTELPDNWRDVEWHNQHYHRLHSAVASARTHHAASARPHIAARAAAPHPWNTKDGARLTLDVFEQHNNKTCSTCLVVSNIVVKLLLTSSGANLTVALVDDLVCNKEFANSTLLRDLCHDVAHAVVSLLSKLDGVATRGGWFLPEIACEQLLKMCIFPCCELTAPLAPQQRMLWFASREVVAPSTDMRVSWITLNATATSVVQWRVAGSQAPPSTAVGVQRTPAEPHGWIGWSHSAVMTNLAANTTYSYRVGSPSQGMSSWTTFTTLPLNAGTEARPLNVVAIADMGLINSEDTIARITALVQSGGVDIVLICGDLAYSDFWIAWADRWGRAVEPFTSRVPFVIALGNHNAFEFNASDFKNRYWPPQPGYGAPSDAVYYSFNAGPVSFVMMNSETWYDGADLDAVQMRWATARMQEANRKPGTFLFVAHHRPLYSSADEAGFALNEHLREQAEPTYNAQRVDYVMSGHLHSYERTYPVRDGNVTGTSYLFPTAPVYCINGAAGQREGMNDFRRRGVWSAKQISKTVGYQLLSFAQRRHASDGKLHTTMASSFLRSDDNAPLDSFVLTSSR